MQDAVKQKIEDFRAYLIDRENSENTISAYVQSVAFFFSTYDEMTSENVRRFKATLISSGMKPSTVNLRLCAINAFCKMEGISAHAKKVKQQKISSVENVIKRDEYETLLQRLIDDGNMRWYWNIRLLASTGARVSEYVRITKSDLDRGYSELWTKGKVRRIYIPQSFRTDSRDYYSEFHPSATLVQGKYGSITSRGVSQMLQNLSKKYGIRKEVMHPHSFRHMFAIEFLNKNGNLTLLSDVLGHSSVATTAIYTRLTKEQQLTEINNTITW